MLDRGQLNTILRGENKDLATVGILRFFRFSPYGACSRRIPKWPFKESALLARAENLLPSLFEMFSIRLEDEELAAHLILNTCLEYIFDAFLLKNPRVSAGTRRKIHKHLKDIRAASHFFLTCSEGLLARQAEWALSPARTPATTDDQLGLLDLLEALSQSSFASNYALSFASCVAVLMDIEARAQKLADRKISPKLRFADRCIALFQSFGPATISTSPNSRFLDFVALVFELATGQVGSALEGSAKRAWKAVREDGGLHHVLMPQRDAEEIHLGDLPKDPLAAEHVRKLKKAVSRADLRFSEGVILRAALMNALERIEIRDEADENLRKDLRKLLVKDPAL